MPKGRRRNKRLDAPHVRLYRWLLDSPAYLSLSCPARAVLVEIVRCYDGFNNGRVGLSVRKAAERCKIAPGTAKRAFEELQDRGFIECVTKGAFSRKTQHASEWRLTFWKCDVTGELASKKFMRWGREKQNAVSKYPVTVSNRDHLTEQKVA
jgi:DNA-binding transcriptional regulator YhcF (GntR family)